MSEQQNLSNQTTANQENTILVSTKDPADRGDGQRKLPVGELSENVNLFLEQVAKLLEHAPQQLGSFQFSEFEVHAEITAKGSLSLMGVGGEAGATGGLKFVFRRRE